MDRGDEFLSMCLCDFTSQLGFMAQIKQRNSDRIGPDTYQFVS